MRCELRELVTVELPFEGLELSLREQEPRLSSNSCYRFGAVHTRMTMQITMHREDSMQTHVSPRLGMAHESLCCRSEATAHLARFTCVLRPRQKIASKFDGLVHLLRVLRGAVWIYGTSASCGQSFLVCLAK